MPPPITRAGWIRIAAITIVGLAILPFTSGYHQFWAYRRTRALEEKLKPILAADARFKNIRLEVSYGMAGVIWVAGQVDSDADKEELRRIIAQNNSSPSVHVWFHEHTPAELSEMQRKWEERKNAREDDHKSN
jgi:hypothetical protein